MASPGNKHCAICIGTLSCPVNTQHINFQGVSIKQNQYLVRRLAIAAMRPIVSVVAWSVCLSVCLFNSVGHERASCENG